MVQDLTRLPADLLAPEDDGACQKLPGRRLPSVSLASTEGRQVDLSSLSGTTVLYCYPRTGRPGERLPEGWDAIPGARGFTRHVFCPVFPPDANAAQVLAWLKAKEHAWH